VLDQVANALLAFVDGLDRVSAKYDLIQPGLALCRKHLEAIQQAEVITGRTLSPVASRSGDRSVEYPALWDFYQAVQYALQRADGPPFVIEDHDPESTLEFLETALEDAGERKQERGRRDSAAITIDKRDLPVLKDRLAALSHGQWSQWMRYLFKHGWENRDGVWCMETESMLRWRRQMGTAYVELPPEEQLSDQAEAEKVLSILRGMER